MTDGKYQKIDIHWFPGHMTKAGRMIEQNVSMVDAVCEIIDARIPAASRNPDIDRLSAGKPRLVVMNRVDQADPSATAQWRAWFRAQGLAVLETDARSGKGVKDFPAAVRALLSGKIAAWEAKGQGTRPVRAMVLGIPNVGKSTFINKLAGRRAAAVSDRPGVTRGRQWISVGRSLELLDTPGILWPRFDSQEVGELLAATGAVKDDVLDREALAANLLVRLRELYPEAIAQRYGLTSPDAAGWEMLEAAAKRRGFLAGRGEYDAERMAAVLLDEFRGGKLGRITLERPDES